MDIQIYQATHPVGVYVNTLPGIVQGKACLLVNPLPVPSMVSMIWVAATSAMILYLDEANDTLAQGFLTMLDTAMVAETLTESEREDVEYAKTYLRYWGKYCSARQSYHMRENPLHESPEQAYGNPGVPPQVDVYLSPAREG